MYDNINNENNKSNNTILINCPNCGKTISEEFEHCPYCKFELHTEPNVNKEPLDRGEISIIDLFNKISSIPLKRFRTISTVLLILFCISFGTNIHQFNNANGLKYELNDSLNELDEANDEISSLTLENSNQKAKIEEERSKKEQLQTEISEYQDQQATIDELNAKLAELQSQYDTAVQENSTLKAENQSLKEQSNNSSGVSSGGRLPSTSSGYSYSDGIEMVWISETGEKYHNIPDCGRMNPNKAVQMSKASAESSGYTPCSKCF